MSRLWRRSGAEVLARIENHAHAPRCTSISARLNRKRLRFPIRSSRIRRALAARGRCSRIRASAISIGKRRHICDRCRRLRVLKRRRRPPVVAGEKKPGLELEKQLLQLFEAADQYRRTGLYESARYLYQRVHLLSPTSRLGRMAIEHLQELESRLRDSSEEQDRREEPDDWQRDVRNGTIPLGLVRVTY